MSSIAHSLPHPHGLMHSLISYQRKQTIYKKVNHTNVRKYAGRDNENLNMVTFTQRVWVNSFRASTSFKYTEICRGQGQVARVDSKCKKDDKKTEDLYSKGLQYFIPRI